MRFPKQLAPGLAGVLLAAGVVLPLPGLGCAVPPVASPPPQPAGPVMQALDNPVAPGPDGAAPPVPDAPLDAALRTQVIEAALRELTAAYIFPDVARRMEAAVRARMRRHEYDGVTSSVALGRLLTGHLREISHDKHLHVNYSAAPVPPDSTPDKPVDAATRERRASFARRVNHGFERVERLEGNIGYLEMRGFHDPSLGGETAAAAMTFLADTDALIIDLRRNGGGEPAMVALVSTYLFEGEPVHLNDLYFRRGERTQQFWTLPFVPGKRFGQAKPVYVLTSARTFSAAEEFTYNLKNLKRAVIVGETTGGGANPGDIHRLAEHFYMFVPDGRAISPITRTNWEGTGVKPDIEVPAEQALLTAHLVAVKERIEKVDEPERERALRETVGEIQSKLDRLKSAPR